MFELRVPHLKIGPSSMKSRQPLSTTFGWWCLLGCEKGTKSAESVSAVGTPLTPPKRHPNIVSKLFAVVRGESGNRRRHIGHLPVPPSAPAAVARRRRASSQCILKSDSWYCCCCTFEPLDLSCPTMDKRKGGRDGETRRATRAHVILLILVVDFLGCLSKPSVQFLMVAFLFQTCAVPFLLGPVPARPFLLSRRPTPISRRPTPSPRPGRRHGMVPTQEVSQAGSESSTLWLPRRWRHGMVPTHGVAQADSEASTLRLPRLGARALPHPADWLPLSAVASAVVTSKNERSHPTAVLLKRSNTWQNAQNTTVFSQESLRWVGRRTWPLQYMKGSCSKPSCLE